MAETVSGETTWTVGRLIQWTTSWFGQRQVEGGRLAAELLLARAMGCRKIDLYTRYDQEPTPEQRSAFRELVRRAGEHTPIAYLLGRREFFSLEFEVTPAVLVPRPETEALVQRAVDICRGKPEHAWRIADIGTGSGCIAVAVARFAANCAILATDISDEALQVAICNVATHGLQDRISLVQADGCRLPGDAVPAGGFDLLVSNPPYISDRVWAALPPHIRDHEPRLALTGWGGDGLEMYRRFAVEAPAILSPGGRLLVEIGHDQRSAVEGIFHAAGGWGFTGAYRDPTDPHDRVLEFVLLSREASGRG